MTDENVFRLPPDAKEFTQEDARRHRYGAGKARIDSTGAVRVDSTAGEKFRQATPGEITYLRSFLSESAGIAALYRGNAGMPVRNEVGNHSLAFGFAARLAELKVEIPDGWTAVVDAWVEPKVEGIDMPCLILDIRNRELIEVTPSQKKAPAPGEQPQGQKGAAAGAQAAEKKGTASGGQPGETKAAAADQHTGEQKGSAAGEQPEEEQ